MSAQDRPAAPGGVSIVAVLAIAIGIIQLLGGLLLIIFNGDVDGWSSGEAVFVGIVMLISGAIYFWVGRGLLKLNPTALMIGLFVSGLRILFDVILIIAIGIAGIGFSGVINIIINVLVFGALWSGRRAFAANL
jgi:hypothetical protein